MKGSAWFTLRTDKVQKDGKLPIGMFYSVLGQRKRYSTEEKIFPEYWDSIRQRAFYLPLKEAKKKLPNIPTDLFLTEIEVNDINDNLNKILKSVKKHEMAFLEKKIQFSAEMVIDLLVNEKKNIASFLKTEEPKNFLFDFMDEYISDHSSIRESGSLSVYKSVKNHLKAYQDETRHKVSFATIDYSFFQKFQTFLISRTKTDTEGKVRPMLNNTTIAKALSTLKTFLGYAKKHGIKISDSYRDFTIKKEKLEVIALDQDELDTLLKLDLSDRKRLDKARDLFCFACATGLRYSDIAQLKREHISKDTITLNVTKTKTELTIPLNSVSASLLGKYAEMARPLPLVSNQNLNYAIKDLCNHAGIHSEIEIVRFHGKKRVVKTFPKYELIHFHTARKTFVTLSLEKGMSAEEVMTISGHEDYKSFSRYVKVTEKRKKIVMVKAWGEPESKLKVV